MDSFTYKVNDGTADRSAVAVSIAVGGDFGPRTNAEEEPHAGAYLTGGLELQQDLTPGGALLYRSETLPRPIIVAETFLPSTSSVPNEIRAQLTFNGVAGTTYSYNTTGLSPGGSLRFALQADAFSLATGRYGYSVTLTAVYGGNSTSRTYSGQSVVVNRSSSTYAFGHSVNEPPMQGRVVIHNGRDPIRLARMVNKMDWLATLPKQ